MSPFKRRCLAIKLGYDSIASAAAALHDRTCTVMSSTSGEN